jgi:hypothetical protein
LDLAGAGGIEPPNGGIKIRCLTAWLRPTDEHRARNTAKMRGFPLRDLKPVAGKRVQYLDKTLKGFGVVIAETVIAPVSPPAEPMANG